MEKQKFFLKRLKKGFMEYFNYEPTALVNKLLGQNTQDLTKVWTRLNN